MSSTNPFSVAMGLVPTRLPKTGRSIAVIAGKKITDVRQVDADERAAIAAELRRVKERAKYQRQRANPEAMAKREAWYEQNRDKVRAYKKQWDAAHVDQNRKAKREHQRRAYLAEPQKFRDRSRAYYAKNAEEIKAKQRERQRAYYQAHREEIAARRAERKRAEREALARAAVLSQLERPDSQQAGSTT